VAEVILRALADPAPAFRVMTSDWAGEYARLKLADPDGTAVQKMTRSWLCPPEPAVPAAEPAPKEA
jgi:hypothetical protein